MPARTSNTAYLQARAAILAGSPLCHWCGNNPATEADHLIEHDAGGTDDTNNLVPSCKPCNSRRGQLYKAKRDAIVKQRREQAFFGTTGSTPTPLNSVFFSANQPELAGIDADQPVNIEVGSELPRLESSGFRGQSYGPQVAAWAKAHMGLDLMPWQVYALTGQLAHNDDGDLIHAEALVSTARQNGKSIALKALIGWWLTDFARLRGTTQNVMSIANRLDRAESIYADLAPILKEHFGAKLLQAIGRKSATLPDGSKWEVRAASPRLHGASNDLVVLDELFDIDQAVLDEALRPSQIARRSPLLSAWSTAGDSESHAMLQLREQALSDIDAGEPGQLYFAEWSIPPGDHRDESLWRLANPALGTTITLKALRAAAKKDYFLRAHLNLWVTARGAWLDPGVWDTCRSSLPMPPGGILAVDSSVDEARYVGVRAVQIDKQVMVTVEFVVDSETELWDRVNTVMADRQTMLMVTPSLEIHVPPALRQRYKLTGYAELLRYSGLVQKMILEGRVLHTGSTALAEHISRAVMVKTAQGVVLSSQKSPGPIELARCSVWAISEVSRPTTRQKPMLVVSG